MAASYGYKEIVKILIDSGADITRKTILENKTALNLAMENGHGETAKILRTVKKKTRSNGRYKYNSLIFLKRIHQSSIK